MKLHKLLLAFAAALTIVSCSESNDAFFSATEDDAPRILNTDIPEMSNGEKANLPSIYRDQTFSFTAIVTPTQYTTVTWYIDGQEYSTGNTIEADLLAGSYWIRIEAVTTKGKKTYRDCSLEVLPLDSDPALASDDKSRWLIPGTTATISGMNISGIKALYVGGVKAEDFVNNGSSLSFTVPELEADYYYQIVVEDDERQYGCGDAYVTNDKYVEPGVQEVSLWEGTNDINWGESNINITPDQLAEVPVGAIIKIDYTVPNAEYHAMRITTTWWGDNAEDNLVSQFDITEDTPNPYEFEYTEACKALCDERGGMLIVGFGYQVTRVYYEKQTVAKETVLWEGSNDINWGESNINITADQLANVKVGSTISLYYTVPDAEYHAMRITTTWWGDNAEDNLVGQFDITADTPNPYQFEYTEACKALCDERGGMLIVGFGYNVSKVTFK